MEHTCYLLLSSTVIQLLLPELTSSGSTLSVLPMKILLSQQCQLSGSTCHQKSTNPSLGGGILGTMRSDFPELSLLFGTGMTGLSTTQDRYGNTGVQGNKSLYRRAWTHRVVVSRSLEQSGSPKPYLSASIWWIMSKGSFTPCVLASLGQEVSLDSMTLSKLTSGTRLEETLQAWLQMFSLEMTNQLLCRYLTRTFLTPYWMSEPYSGSGRIIRNSRTYGLSPASISLNPNAPKIYYTHFEVLQPISMLSVPYWTDDGGGFIAPNYHFCPDYELDSFFQLMHIGWVDPNFDDFPDLSNLEFFLDEF